MLAFGKPTYPLIIALGVGVIEILLVLWLVPMGGYLVMAAILSGYLAVSIGIIAWKGWRLIRYHEALEQVFNEPTSEDIPT